MLELYTSGLCYCSVCTDLVDRSEVEAETNRVNPTGLDRPWRIADEPFATGENNPCPCNHHEGRRHFLLSC